MNFVKQIKFEINSILGQTSNIFSLIEEALNRSQFQLKKKSRNLSFVNISNYSINEKHETSFVFTKYFALSSELIFAED